MVGRRIQLAGGYSFYIAYRGKKWFANCCFSDVTKAQAVMLEVMKAGNLCDCPLLAIGKNVIYQKASV